jgi:hypothetical protein
MPCFLDDADPLGTGDLTARVTGGRLRLATLGVAQASPLQLVTQNRARRG